MGPRPEVEVDGLTKRYPPPFHPLKLLRRSPDREALRGVSFTIEAGEVVALIGPNGAGKSTLLRILAGLLLPSSGVARVCGLDVVRDRPRCRARVGTASSDDRGLSPRLTVRQNLRFFGALYDLRPADIEARIRTLAERLEASHLLDRAVRTLSGGERARSALMRALLHRPRVVLLDELTRALDPGAAARLRRQLRAMARSDGMAVLFASHDLSEVEALASRVLLLAHGAAAGFGPFAEVQPRAEQVFAGAEGGSA
jgi:ABC-type multidrug transport system ATPase subunit